MSNNTWTDLIYDQNGWDLGISMPGAFELFYYLPIETFSYSRVFRFVDPQSLTARVQIWCLLHIKWAKPSNGCNLGLVSQVTYNLAQKMSYIPNICHLNIVNLGQCLKVPLSFAGCNEKRKEKCSQNGCVWGIIMTAAFKLDHLLPVEPLSYKKFSTSVTLKA